MTTKDYQMFWDCAHCGTKKLLGVSHRHCPNCGAAQDENKRYFPADGEEVELENHIYFGVDWDCQYCSTPNSNHSNNCVNCGGGKDGTYNVNLVGQLPNQNKIKNVVPVVPVDEVSVKKPVVNQESVASHSRRVNRDSISSSVEKEKSSSGSGSKINVVTVLISLVMVAFVSFLIYGFMKVDDHKVTVIEKTWSRSIDIEQYRAVSDTDWCSGMPSDAYNVSRYRDIRSHRQVAEGQSCSTSKHDRGDGSYRTVETCHTKYRSEPVYDDRCRYSVNRWKFSNSVLAQGNQNQKAYFPDVSNYGQRTGNFLGNTRVGSRHENYKVMFTYEDKKTVNAFCNYSQDRWEQFGVREQYDGRVRMIGGLICNEIVKKGVTASIPKKDW